MPSDLHMHTTFSDGKLTPEELIAAAKAANLKYISITDHDTVEGIGHLYENGFYPARGIHIIPGIEFSAHHPLRDIHILGYNVELGFVNYDDSSCYVDAIVYGQQYVCCS